MLKNLVKMAVPNPGSVTVGSTITLGAAPTGYQSFLAAFGAGAPAFFMLSDGAGRTLGGVWTVNSSTPATATITEILFNLRLGGTAGETFSSACTAWNTLPAGEALVPRQGGTLTGGLSGTTANFSGNLNMAGTAYIRNSAPTIHLRDTDHQSAALHNNSNRFYIISCPVDSTTFQTPPNGRWPFEARLDTGDIVIGRNLDVNAGTVSTAAVSSSGEIGATGNISTSNSFTTAFAWNPTQGQVVFGNAGRRLFFNGGDQWDFNGHLAASSMRLGGGAVYYEGSLAVATYWDGRIRHTHEIGAPSISCQDVYANWISNTSGGSPYLRTADGRGIVFQFVDDWANYVRFFRSDGFTNYLMQSPNQRYMDARDWGGTWATLIQDSGGGNQIFFPAAYSDERLKTNIAPTQVDALAAIAAVEVVEYDWNEDGLTIGHMHSQLKHVEIGVIGQQAVEHVPEMFEAGPVPLPNGDTEYRMTFHPEKAVPYLIRAIQQQQELIIALTARLAAIEAATSAGGRNA